MYLSTPIKLVGKEQLELSFIIHATKQPGEFKALTIVVYSVTQERGNSIVHQQSPWSAVGDDITNSQQEMLVHLLKSAERILQQLQSTFSAS